MKYWAKVLILVVLFTALSLPFFLKSKATVPSLSTARSPEPKFNQTTVPLDHARERVTKKPFGLYVTPNSSPVKPEKFTGYHTGVDFEIFSGEENQEIEVRAICDGKIVLERYAVQGYGGVKVQQCNLNNEEVIVIYGHLKTEAKTLDMKLGDMVIKKGERIGVLGKGYSEETDGERKHLHLGIHKGPEINIKGYVQDKAELKDWIDVQSFLSLK